MYKFKPTIYRHDIFDIDYDALYNKKIRLIAFDLDNTLGLYDDKECSDEVKKLIFKLKEKFKIVIITNGSKRRITPYKEALGVEGFHMSFKPFTRGLKKARELFGVSKEEMAIVGDQLVTDILAGNTFGITTILVEPLGVKDLQVTKVNRIIENTIFKRYRKKNILERGKYYG